VNPVTRHLRRVLALAAMTVSFVAIANPPGAGNRAPSWLLLRQGVPAYTGNDGGTATTLTVCPSAAIYRKWIDSAVERAPATCTQRVVGASVTIATDALIPLDGKAGPAYVTYIRADDSSWSGWTQALALVPRIPPHTHLVVESFAVVHLASSSTTKDTGDASGGVLESGTVVELISQNEKSNDRDLYVLVVSGPRAVGAKGWVYDLDLRLPGGGPLVFRAPP
jgi:hypothetical protein